MPRTPLKERRLKTHQATTLVLKVPRIDWAKVIAGEKLQIRHLGACVRLEHVDVPRPIVVYSYRLVDGVAEKRLMVLTGTTRHPIGAISQEDIEAEGFKDLKEFRRYWIVRDANNRRGGFKPLAMCTAYYLRPFDHETDPELMSRRIFNYLYGEYL